MVNMLIIFVVILSTNTLAKTIYKINHGSLFQKEKFLEND